MLYNIIINIFQTKPKPSGPQPIEAPRCGLHKPEGLALAKVSGRLTQEGEWPHTCLMYNLARGRPVYFGGATLIAAGVLVTAAHKIQ